MQSQVFSNKNICLAAELLAARNLKENSKLPIQRSAPERLAPLPRRGTNQFCCRQKVEREEDGAIAEKHEEIMKYRLDRADA